MQDMFGDSLTVREVSQILEVSERSVREFINSGELKASKVGKWRISKDAVRAFIEARSNEYADQARSDIRRFLGNNSKPEKGVRTMVVRDYAAGGTKDLFPIEVTISSIPDGSGFRWAYLRGEDGGFDRHVLYGDMKDITRVITELDRIYRLPGEDS